MHTRPLVSLVGMFRDEAKNVAATLKSARQHVDRWLITDTGSADGTQNVIREAMRGMPGELHETQAIRTKLKRSDLFVFDFAANRNLALDLVQDQPGAPVFTLFLSGHETLHVDGDALRTFLEKHRDATDGAYCVEIRSGTRSFPYTRVLRVDAEWRYRSMRGLHESPVGPNGEVTGPSIPGVIISHAPPLTDRDRKMRRIREQDLPTLQDIVEDESLSLEERGGAILFLAETHALIAADYKEQSGGNITPGGHWLSHQMAALALYWRYAQLGEQPDRPGYNPHKVRYALALYYSLIADVPGPGGHFPKLYTHAEIAQRLEMLVTIAPDLPEARYLLAKHAAQSDPVTGPKIGLYHATEAAKVARRARANPTYEVSETTLEWRSLLLASACAEHLQKAATSRAENLRQGALARKLIEEAVAVGAPLEVLAKEPSGDNGKQKKT
jgi:hypothetical protein